MSKNTVLVVEDNEHINRLFCKQLTLSDYDCQSVYSVQSAIQTMQESGKPDVIILDLDLGDGSGMEVLDYLKGDPEKYPKVFVVSANSFSSQYSTKGYGIDHVLLKPISPRGLTALIHYELMVSSRKGNSD